MFRSDDEILSKNDLSGRRWSGPEQYETPDGELMMLPSDMVLINDVDFIDTVIEYASDYDTFAADFAAAFKKLTEFGVVAPTDGTTLASATEVESPLPAGSEPAGRRAPLAGDDGLRPRARRSPSGSVRPKSS